MRFNAVLVLAAGFLRGASQLGKCQSEVDIVVVIDASGGVDDLSLKYQRKFVYDVAPALAAEYAHMGVVVYSDKGHVVHEITGDADALRLAMRKNPFRPDGYTRNTADALATAGQMLMSSGRGSAQSTVLLVMAGSPSNIGGMDHMASQIKQQARLIIVPVGYSDVLNTRAAEWCSYPSRNNFFGYANMAGLTVQKFLPELCPRLVSALVRTNHSASVSIHLSSA